MPYRRTVVVRDGWVFWAIVLALWTLFVAVLWFRIGGPVAIAASILLVFPLVGIVVGLKSDETELVVDGEHLWWGTPGNTPFDKIEIGKIKRITREQGPTLIEVEGETFLRQVPWMFSGRELCEHLQKTYPHVRIDISDEGRPVGGTDRKRA